MYAQEQYEHYKSLEHEKMPLCLPESISDAARKKALNLLFRMAFKQVKASSPVIFFNAVWCLDRLYETYPNAEGLQPALASYVLCAKMEDEELLLIDDLTKYTDLSTLWEAEDTLWETLDHNMTCPNMMHFLRYISWESEDEGNLSQRTIAKLLLCVVVYNREYLQYKPSLWATTALCLAVSITTNSIDSLKSICQCSGYSCEEMMEPSRLMVQTYIHQYQSVLQCVPIFHFNSETYRQLSKTVAEKLMIIAY